MSNAYPKIFFSKNPYTIDNIRIWIKNNTNYKLISIEYKGAYEKLELECPLHGNFKISWNKLFQGEGCSNCVNNKKYTLKEIIQLINYKNSNIEVISKEYNGINEKITCKCKIDNYVWDITPHNILANNNGCPECKRRLFLGENNPNYNFDLSKEEREQKRLIVGKINYDHWRNYVLNRDNYTCKCCGDNKGGNLNVHHLNGWNWDKEHRLDVDNGITLCKKCHKEFHSEYGKGNNTEQQFEYFLKNKKEHLIP